MLESIGSIGLPIFKRPETLAVALVNLSIALTEALKLLRHPDKMHGEKRHERFYPTAS